MWLSVNAYPSKLCGSLSLSLPLSFSYSTYPSRSPSFALWSQRNSFINWSMILKVTWGYFYFARFLKRFQNYWSIYNLDLCSYWQLMSLFFKYCDINIGLTSLAPCSVIALIFFAMFFFLLFAFFFNIHFLY